LEVPPAIIVFTNNAGPSLVEKIVPAIDSKYNTIDSREGRSIVCNGFVASPGLTIALKNPDLFSAVGLQSPLVFADAKDAIVEELAKLDQPIRIYMEWGRYDMFNPHENWDIRKRGQELFQIFADNKNIQLAGGEVNDSTDWSSWRNRFDVMLQHLTNDE
jgi:enterochelin esterase-like enzyme